MKNLLPPYTVRVSPRAKRVILRVTPAKGLEVVVPEGYDRSGVAAVVEGRRAWIERVFERLRLDPGACGSPPEPPARIEYQAVGRSFDVEYLPRPGRAPALAQNGPDRLILTGELDRDGSIALLVRFTRLSAERLLVPWLRQVSLETDLPFAKAQVRLQRSRWASCSASRVISLNMKLLFLRPELVRYIFIHELCHLKSMDHSPCFWGYVAELEPGYRELDRAMRLAGRDVPTWVGSM